MCWPWVFRLSLFSSGEKLLQSSRCFLPQDPTQNDVLHRLPPQRAQSIAPPSSKAKYFPHPSRFLHRIQNGARDSHRRESSPQASCSVIAHLSLFKLPSSLWWRHVFNVVRKRRSEALQCKWKETDRNRYVKAKIGEAQFRARISSRWAMMKGTMMTAPPSVTLRWKVYKVAQAVDL